MDEESCPGVRVSIFSLTCFRCLDEDVTEEVDQHDNDDEAGDTVMLNLIKQKKGKSKKERDREKERQSRVVENQHYHHQNINIMSSSAELEQER